MIDAYGKQIPHRILRIAPGARGTRETLSIMRGVSLEASKDPRLRQLGIRIVADFDPRNDRKRAGALLRWVQDQIRYVRDIRKCETIQTPQRTLLWKAGDCDDFSSLIAALLLALGFVHVAFVAQKREPQGSYRHVFVVVWIEDPCSRKGLWYKMDGTSKKPLSPMPWDPQRHMAMRV